jgi:hypothetical protein
MDYSGDGEIIVTAGDDEAIHVYSALDGKYGCFESPNWQAQKQVKQQEVWCGLNQIYQRESK